MSSPDDNDGYFNPEASSVFGDTADNVSSFINQGALPHYPYAQHATSLSRYATLDSRIERISGIMNGLSLRGSSSSSNGLALSAAGSARGVGRMDPYPLAASRLGGVVSSLTASSSSSGYNGVETNLRSYMNDLNQFVLGLAMSKYGVGYLIGMMADGNRTNTILILSAVVIDVYRVMTCEHGLKLISNLLRFCDQTQKEYLFAKVVSDPDSVIFCSTSLYGSKALIQLVDHLQGSGLIQQLPSILAMEIGSLVQNCPASSVIKHCLIILNADQCQLLYEAMTGCAFVLAVNVHGCSLLYSLIDNVRGSHRSRLLNILADNSIELASHPSGNYVLNYILQLKDSAVTLNICFNLLGHYKTLAKDKHGSHVVENCIESAGIHCVMDEFLYHSTNQELEEIACHEFGNYVMKKALIMTKYSNLHWHGALVGALLPCLRRLRESPFGKAVYKVLAT